MTREEMEAEISALRQAEDHRYRMDELAFRTGDIRNARRYLEEGKSFGRRAAALEARLAALKECGDAEG